MDHMAAPISSQTAEEIQDRHSCRGPFTLQQLNLCTLEAPPPGSNCTSTDRKALHGVICCAEHTTRTTLPTQQNIYTGQCTTRGRKIIIKDIHHPGNKLFQWLRSCVAETASIALNSLPHVTLTAINPYLSTF